MSESEGKVRKAEAGGHLVQCVTQQASSVKLNISKK